MKKIRLKKEERWFLFRLLTIGTDGSWEIKPKMSRSDKSHRRNQRRINDNIVKKLECRLK